MWKNWTVIAVALLGAAILLLVPQTAQAQQYPPPPPNTVPGTPSTGPPSSRPPVTTPSTRPPARPTTTQPGATTTPPEGENTTNVEGNEDGTITISGVCHDSDTVTYVVRRGAQGQVIDSGTIPVEADNTYSETVGPYPRGAYSVTVTCGDDTEVLSASVGAPAQGGASGALPRTGTDSSIPMARLGVILVAAGGVAVYGAKKRNGRRAAFLVS